MVRSETPTIRILKQAFSDYTTPLLLHHANMPRVFLSPDVVRNAEANSLAPCVYSVLGSFAPMVASRPFTAKPQPAKQKELFVCRLQADKKLYRDRASSKISTVKGLRRGCITIGTWMQLSTQWRTVACVSSAKRPSWRRSAEFPSQYRTQHAYNRESEAMQMSLHALRSLLRLTTADSI